MLKQIDERRSLLCFPSKDAALEGAMEDFICALKGKGSASIALSGGSTPKALYEKLAREAKELLSWEHFRFFWGDERCVPLDHQDSNYRTAKESGLLSLGGKSFPMWQKAPVELLAPAYAKLLPDSIDYFMAGVGEDGHTLSIFPGSDAFLAPICGQKVVLTGDSLHPHPRLSTTLEYANRAKRLVVYLLGDSKKEIARRLFDPKGAQELPAWHLGTKERPALFFTDFVL